MFNRVVFIDVFDSGVRNAAVVFEKWRKPPASNVATLIDSGGQYRAAELAKPYRIIGAAAEE
jgi:hypothetical protein